MSTTIRIGGVPEHFNLPWQLAAEKDVFSSANINFTWTVYAGGTGAMTKALSNGELDVAILLTEGYISAVNQGLKAKIAKVYIDSPLVWGIYTGVDSGLDQLSASVKYKYAISRFGSGSHLMAMIHAGKLGRTLSQDDFVVVNSLHGAMESLKLKETGVFYWEKFMTRPYIKSGSARLIGEFSAPWSSFLIVVSEQFLERSAEVLKKTLQIMNAECITFKQDNSSAIYLSKRFDMSLVEARKWLQDTQWNYDYKLRKVGAENARDALAGIAMCDKELNLNKLGAPWISII